ncbi:M48 family metallopeptidase [Methylocapsa palsarum]|uniref:STE24 endopeptidase n=1 Tax=Methylocapsa palsarum TaxID=1612308 RepID=A0A1I4C4V8_9HYPH|nr:M48 family metallopeptidase [Methylocapsa palsarum]SFK75349.1 STE24 endopeptidase [Methylocapsa palsarum]
MPFLSIGFIIAASVWAALSLYLSMRQVSYVLARRDAVPADFAGAISQEEHRKAADYTVARERFSRYETLIELALSAAWVFGGINLLYGSLASVLSPSLWLGVAFFIGTMAVGAIVSLPLDLYKTFVLEQKFGFNRTTLQTFAADRVKGAVIFLAVAVPLLFAALFVMRAFAGLWWLWVWLGLVVLMVAAPTVYVRLIAPRFNQFAPLADEALRLRIERLLNRCGFRSSGLFTMDASKRSAHGNAFFIGFGAAKRIVLFDTLLSHSTPEEVEAVVAHELGHFKHRHVLYSIVRSAIVTFAALAAFGWLAKQPWLLPAFGIGYKDDALALFVCTLLASVVGPLAAPVGNWISRRNEFQADDYARQNVGAGPMVSALTKLARDNASTLTPDPVYALVNYSHPPVPIRIRHLRRAETPGSGKMAAPISA